MCLIEVIKHLLVFLVGEVVDSSNVGIRKAQVTYRHCAMLLTSCHARCSLGYVNSASWGTSTILGEAESVQGKVA